MNREDTHIQWNITQPSKRMKQWMALELITLRKVNQKEKDKHNMTSLISESKI